MAEVKKSLTPVQFSVLFELEKELGQLEAALTQAKTKRAMAYGLIFDSMGVTDASGVRFEPDTQTIVISTPELDTPV